MNVYIARQPIYGKDKKVTGYELLYRDNMENSFRGDISGEAATLKVVSEALLNFGMEALTGLKKGYVNFTEKLLTNEFTELLDSELFVIEVLEEVNLTEEVVKCLKKCRARGYTIALDDYCGKPLGKEDLDCFDIIKMDFILTTPGTRKRIAKKMQKAGKCLLAEKIETEEDFLEALELGCELFQGYYFAKPMVLKKQQKNIANITAVRLIGRLSDEWMDMSELANIIRLDAHLTYKLLRKMKTVKYYRSNAVQSIKDALIRMGVDEIRHWMLLVLVQDVADKEDGEQVCRALTRAVFCENMAKFNRKAQLTEDAFTTGIFSVMDLTDEELPHLLSELDIRDRVTKALMGENNTLHHYLKVVMLYEAGDWDELLLTATKKELRVLPDMYMEAVRYADTVMREGK